MLELLLTKEVLQVLLPVLGVLAVGFGIYFKGRSDKELAINEELQEAKDELERGVKDAQKKVRDLEVERRKRREKTRDASGNLSKLIKLWNEKFRPKN